MFFYEFDNLDNFIHMDLRKKLTEEMNRIEHIIRIYESKKEVDNCPQRFCAHLGRG